MSEIDTHTSPNILPVVDPHSSDPKRSSESILRRRIRKFRRLKRGYWSFLIIVSVYALSFFLPQLAGQAMVSNQSGYSGYWAVLSRLCSQSAQTVISQRGNWGEITMGDKVSPFIATDMIRYCT